MSMSVTVLCPGGRRQVVKVTPNTSLLQVLEEACAKQKLDAKSFNLMHYNRPLDLSSSVRFSNLPNRAQLELAPSAQSRVDGDVTIGLQLADGRRLVKQFSCNATLWEVLEHHSVLPAEAHLAPVCIYAGREVAGETALRTTTVRSLGLTAGSAIIRFAPRPASQLSGSQAHVSAPLVRPSAPEPVSQPEPPPAAADSAPEPMDQSPAAEPPVSQSHPPTSAGLEPASQRAAAPAGASQSQTAPAPDRGDVTYETPPTASEVIQASSDSVLVGPRTSTVNDAVQSKESFVSVRAGASCGSVASQASGETFLVEGASLGSSSSEAETDHKHEERIVYLGARKAVAFSLDDVTTSLRHDELPDDFYDVTEEDARKRLRQLRDELASMEESPLLTSQQRETRRQADLLTRLSRHRHTCIRLQFPDRLVLQGVFQSTDTVASVMEFAASFLEDPAAKFTLYTTPPKTTLPPSARLFELDCVPAALVHVAAEGGATVALSAAVRSQLSSPAGAAAALSSVRPSSSTESADSDTPTPAPGSGSSSGSGSGGARSRTARAPAAGASGAGADRKDVPRWFKMGRK